jgi:hypothetical protein
VSNLGDLDRLFALIKREKGKLEKMRPSALAFGRLARSALHNIFDRTLLDLGRLDANFSATPVVSRRPFGNSVGSTEFLRWDDPYHST